MLYYMYELRVHYKFKKIIMITLDSIYMKI